MFDFAIRVYNGELEDSDINRPHIFNVLYPIFSERKSTHKRIWQE